MGSLPRPQCRAARGQRDAIARGLPRADACLRAAPQKYDETTAPLAETLRSSEFAAAAATGAKALAPSVGLAILGTIAFGPLAIWLRSFINGEGLAVLANDEGQYFQNYVNAIDVMFSLLLVNTFAWLYNQQEQLYVSLFAEVSVAKALLEQIAYVSRGRPDTRPSFERAPYVDDDPTRLSAERTALLGGPINRGLSSSHVAHVRGSPGTSRDRVEPARARGSARRVATEARRAFLLLAVLGARLAIFP